MQFNPSQEQALNHDKGPMLVLAGPGSGKTAVITERVRRLIEIHHAPPEKILVITFSRSAALEMKQRFERLTSSHYTSVNFGTFHAVFFKIIKSAYRYDNSSIITEEDRFRVIYDAARKHKLALAGDRELVQKLSAAISRTKSEAADPLKTDFKLCSPEAFGKIYGEYESFLKSEEKLDFDDMMLTCLNLFSERAEVLKYWQERYEYILIDEFQDINSLQYKLVRELAVPENNVFAVGDDDQSIYGFRGARPEIMQSFEKDFEGCGRILLNVNYRCREEILNAAVRLVSNNTRRYEKQISAAREGGRFECISFKTLEDENRYLLDYLCAARDAGRELGRTAVLYRMNHEARTLYRMLCEHNIKCRLYEQIPCIYDHWIADDLISYMKLAREECSRGEFLRIMNRPARYVTRQSVCEAATERVPVRLESIIAANRERMYVENALIDLHRQMKIMQKFDPLASVKYIRYAIGYNSYIKEYAKTGNVSEEELFDILDELEDSTRGFDTFEDWVAMMENARKLQKENRMREEKDTSCPDAVELMTFHCSKGLEFDTVFIIDALEGMTPQLRAQLPGEIEEERRAFYVAMTRARDELYILSSESRLGRILPVSRFVHETDK